MVLWVMVGMMAGGVAGCKPRQWVRETPYMQSDPNDWIRVLLHGNIAECNLSSQQSLQIRDSQDQLISIHPAEQAATFAVMGGQLTLNDQSLDVTEVRVVAEAPLISVLGHAYRGQMRIAVDSEDDVLDVINELPMEPYLAGVVGAEMPRYWEPEALKAQAIVARTYCLYIKQRFGGNRAWDLSRTQAHQVYRGERAESSSVWAAIDQTAGMILMTPDEGGQLQVFPTFYSSVCGGHTEAAQHVFGESAGPQAGVPCSYCEHVALMSQYLWPMAHYSKTEVEQRLQNRYPSLGDLGHIVRIEPLQQSDYQGFSRITMIRLVGDTGRSDTLRAEDLRLVIDSSGRRIKSTVCRIEDWQDQWAFVEGRGWGHGVGMCQCGAQGMAREGNRSADILFHYFPNSVLKKLY